MHFVAIHSISSSRAQKLCSTTTVLIYFVSLLCGMSADHRYFILRMILSSSTHRLVYILRCCCAGPALTAIHCFILRIQVSQTHAPDPSGASGVPVTDCMFHHHVHCIFLTLDSESRFCQRNCCIQCHGSSWWSLVTAWYF